ncbi:pilus assembly protein N-terminal domain-containing protein [Caulobacter sp. 1776]|uniref:pilus assembly protein N-terminal domain-containing protein n=1 Tax=Caulobacter sp. 1776 TaxID=3156420 RepID=UPI0033952665
MRRLSLVITAALTLSGGAASAQTAARAVSTGALPIASLPVDTPTDLPVAAGQASYVNLAGAVRDVVVGDPTIADVSVVNNRTLVVLGKRPGVTSLLAFGAGGRALADRQVVVSENGGGAVTVYRGAAASNYACAAQCTRLGAPAGTP